jgi:hypothetical protein
MNKNITTFYAIENETGKLVQLGAGEATDLDKANLLADLYESVALSLGNKVTLGGPIFTIEDLYRLKAEMAEALDNLPVAEMEVAALPVDDGNYQVS